MTSHTRTTDLSFVDDDGGREEAGCTEHAATDCGVRALSVFTLDGSGLDAGENYKRCYELLSDRKGKMKGVSYLGSRKAYRKSGLKSVSLFLFRRMTISEAYTKYGNCIVLSHRPSRHAVALIDGHIRDDGLDETIDSRGRKVKERTVYCVWYVPDSRKAHLWEVAKNTGLNLLLIGISLSLAIICLICHFA